MRAEITVNGGGGEEAGAGYLSWAPSPAQVRLAEPDGAAGPVAVTLRNRDAAQGGQLVFLADPAADPAAEPLDELALELPETGEPVDLLVAGRFGSPSVEDGDAGFEVVLAGDGEGETAAGEPIGSVSLMVRVRKNAEALTDAERDRFLDALARLNDQGFGGFQAFRDMHRDDTSREAHGRSGFLPWHRAYLLDLERELQALVPSVALPYWRFDQPAPRLFTTAFFGVSDASGRVQVDPSNPLRTWTTDNQVGILRGPRFDPATSGAGFFPFPGFFVPVLDEATTLDLGTAYEDFLEMEGDPHGPAHTSFSGFIRAIDTAAKDPLFFLLHANVDRLWAKWQWLNRRFDLTSTDTYPFLGVSGDPGATRVGHNRGDTMWPWNQVTGFPRPNTAPGGSFPPSAATAAPAPEPVVGEMVPWQGNGDPAARLGFDYDDVPWEPPAE